MNKSHLIVIVAALCLIISGCSGGGTTSNLPKSDLPDCETVYQASVYSVKDWNNCQGAVQDQNGGQYVGEFKNGMFHGQGIYTWASGSQYVGEWKDDVRHGQGTHTYYEDRHEKWKVIEGIWKEGACRGCAITDLETSN